MEEKKEHIYVIIIGHDESGKSTVTGRLICEYGDVDENEIHKMENEFENEASYLF